MEASVQDRGPAWSRPRGPPGAGVWHWQPNLLLDQVTLAGSTFTGEYTLCDANEGCHPLSHWLTPGQTVTLAACDSEAH
ncbi:hypothetical protein MBH78_22170 [Oceanimonas sp. NS1]|nr:hypothetical protein [Oceanimonas sp. NS1]